MRNRNNQSASNRYWLLALALMCVTLMILSAYSDRVGGPFRVVANATVVPMQAGLNTLGVLLVDVAENFETIEMLRNENAKLQAQVDSLIEDKRRITMDEYELERLRDLLRLDQEYADYETIGARVIGVQGSNWFDTFTINRGSLHGVRVDMNVIAGNGLVGIVTQVGPISSTVRSIIDDTSNVSGMVLSTSDRTIVRGDLSLLNEGRMRFEGMENNENEVLPGDQIVTSYISDKFLQGILIGYIVEIRVDANNLTRSGYIVPVVDFRNIRDVLVITHTKADLRGDNLTDDLEDGYADYPEEDIEGDD